MIHHLENTSFASKQERLVLTTLGIFIIIKKATITSKSVQVAILMITTSYLSVLSSLLQYILFAGLGCFSTSRLVSAKGQLISKANCQAEDSSKKNEQMNSFLLVFNVFSFVFWKNPRSEKNVSRLSDL